MFLCLVSCLAVAGEYDVSADAGSAMTDLPSVARFRRLDSVGISSAAAGDDLPSAAAGCCLSAVDSHLTGGVCIAVLVVAAY